MKAKVEDIIHRELRDSTGDINFKVFNEAIEHSAGQVKMMC